MRSLAVLLILLSASVAAAEPCCMTCTPIPATSTPAHTNTPVPVATSTWTFTPPAATPTSVPTAPGTPWAGGAPIWAVRAGGAGFDVATAVHLAADGTIFVAGYFTGTTDFGLGPVQSAGMDIFLAKYTAAGLPVWAIHTGNGYSNSPLGLTVDHAGNVILAGQFMQSINFGCGTMTSGLPDSYDAFVVKIAPHGSCLWQYKYGSGGDDSAAAVAVDSADNVLVTGYFTGRVSFGGTALYSSNSSGGRSTFVLKLSSSGAHVWSRAFSQGISNNGPDQGYGIATDPAGNVLVAGNFQGTEFFDGASTTTSAGMSEDIYLAKLSSNGTLQWVRDIGSTGSDRAYAVAADPQGNVGITGYFAGNVDFGGASLQATGPLNGFVAEYDGAGTLRGAQAITGPSVNFGNAIAADAAGNWLVAGQFTGLSNFSGTALQAAGQGDAFVAKYAATDGHLQWVRGLGSPLAELAYAVDADPAGISVSAGFFRGTAVVAPLGQLFSAGQTDLYLLKVAP